MKIEELKEKESRQVSKMLVDFWKSRDMNYSLKWARNYLLDGHKSEIKDDKFFVIKDKHIVGIIALVVYEGDLGEVRDFVINKEERGKGYGSQLLNFVVDYAKSKNIRKLFSLVFPEVKESYEKKGFKEEGLLKDHFKDGEDLYYMSLKLKKEKQIGLKDELEKIEVREKTEEQLLKLPVR